MSPQLGPSTFFLSRFLILSFLSLFFLTFSVCHQHSKKSQSVLSYRTGTAQQMSRRGHSGVPSGLYLVRRENCQRK